MTGIGNDIIDLKHSNNNRATDKHFYTKILHSTEIELYNSQTSFSSFEQFVWLLWSIKEAAYKYLKRNHPALPFAPHKIIIQELLFLTTHAPKLTDEFLFALTNNDFSSHNYKSTVLINDTQLTGLSFVCNRFIHTVAIHPEEKKICNGGIKYIDTSSHENQSKFVRDFFLKNISYGKALTNISIAKHELGYPLLMKDDIDMQAYISFSHHGNYVAYTYLEL